MTSTAIRTTRRHTVLLTTLAIVSALILHRIDLPILPALHPSDALEFVNEFGALQVSFGLIRLAALVAAWYVVAITSLALLASLRSGRNAFTSVIEALTIPPLKSLVSGLFGVGIIIMPLTAPALTVVGVFAFLWTWNDFFGPLLYLDDQNKFTVALALATFIRRVGVQWNEMMAANLLSIIPVLIIYFFAQNKLIGGIASVGIKG